ncbi:MAG: hypothetical protein JJU02_11835 [Cryomorphaceae bacterium]|nr:hypothetical protein [Cryomorphaceae bacterium]
MKTSIFSQTAKQPNSQTAKPSGKSFVYKTFKALSLLIVFIFSVSLTFAQDNESGYLYDHITYNFPAISNTPVQNSSCQFTIDDGAPLMPVRRAIERCDADENESVWVRPRFVSGVTLPLYTQLSGINFGSSRMRLKVIYWVNNLPIHFVTTNYISLSGTGFGANFTSNDFNSIAPVRSYSSNVSHNIRTTVTIQSYHWNGWGIWGTWKDSYILETCHSTVTNIDGVPNFSVLAGNYVNNVWPHHYEVNGSNVQIQTTNSCNGTFNLFVAEINQHWQRPREKEAQRWYNTSNQQINLQTFTNGGVSNVVFANEGPFTMTGGTVTPNNEGVSGERYFMIQIGITAPNWSVATKVVKILNNLVEPGDTIIEMRTEVYELNDFIDEHPELEEQIIEMNEELALIFPNPTDGYAALRFSGTKGKLISLIAFDQNGNQFPLPIESFVLGDFRETPDIDVNHLPLGIYSVIAQFENSDKPVSIRFVKN